ncbi:MAG: respiratory nitrate reductase subunit gamma [Pseudomonadota bacterium]
MRTKGYLGVAFAGAVIIFMGIAGLPSAGAGTIPLETGKPVCLDCHRQPNIHTNEGVVTANAFCNGCHEKPDCRRTVDGKAVSLQLPELTAGDNPHHYTACTHCHTDVARSPHKSQTGVRCRSCHSVHGEGTAHAPHLRVDCQACHFASDSVRLDGIDHRIKLAGQTADGEPIGLVSHALADVKNEKLCERCHRPGNTVGASAVVLPAKSVLCVMCHPSPLAIGHPIFWLALGFLLLGFFVMLRFWFLGSVRGEEVSLHRKISLGSDAVWETLFSRRIFTVLKVLLIDIFLQRRILKESVQRWSLHSLIFLAMMARFAMSLFTGLIFSIDPEGTLSLALMDKNHPATAFIYDLLGFLILLGILWALIRRFVVKPVQATAEIEDSLTLIILGVLIILGFMVSAAGILLTRLPAETAVFSFIGFSLSRFPAWLPVDWRSAYPVLWYAHAVAGAALIAYLPFGKLKHVFNVPLTYIMEEVWGVEKVKRV